MMWFKKGKYISISPSAKKDIPEGLWIKCERCQELLFRKEWERSLKVCKKCGYHYPLTYAERLSITVDEGSFVEYDKELEPLDFLHFKDLKEYKERLKEAQERTGISDAIVTGEAKIGGRPIIIGIFEFEFMGGSMASVVGEKIKRATERAIKLRYPLVLFCASGGARMQEGTVALMQMAKTSICIAELHKAGILYIAVFTHPTTGGVLASFASLADIIIAEKGALIGFAGPRVIEQTIRQKLPEGFQRAEFLMEKGFVDIVVHRHHLKETLTKLIMLLWNGRRQNSSSNRRIYNRADKSLS